MNERPIFPDEATCWQAVQTRDARYNGVIYYAVRSTGIYCRPTCPSRRPRRDQVTFFASPDAAEQAGYRPCRRCLPRQQADPALDLVTRARALIESSPEPLSLRALGAQVGASPYHLQRTFKAITGVSPRQYAAALHANAFKDEARAGRDVTKALYAAGYGSGSGLYTTASAVLGMTPDVYRKGGKGMTITYTIQDSALGRLLVAATERGICAVSLGDDDAALLQALETEFPAARLEPGEGQILTWAGAIRAYLEGLRPDLDLPLDVLGTAFQQRVWSELRKIPYGQTRTYTQVAEAIGQPAAVRAVARACATNPAALVTPCHRVIRSDGSLGGYRWGLSRKQALLQTEQDR